MNIYNCKYMTVKMCVFLTPELSNRKITTFELESNVLITLQFFKL